MMSPDRRHVQEKMEAGIKLPMMERYKARLQAVESQ